MVKILYGVCGVGMGHAIRSAVIINELRKKHEVFVISSHEAYEYLRKKTDRIKNIEGFELVLSRNAILNFKSFIRNFQKASFSNFMKFKKTEQEISNFNPDIVISDWESYSSLYSKKYDIPLLSVDNAHYLLYGDYKFPKKHYFQFVKAKYILKLLMANAQHYIIFCFDKQKLKKSFRTIKVLPVIRKEILNAKTKNKNFVLVYLTSRKYKNLNKVFNKINENFIVYGTKEKYKEGNISFKPFEDGREFVKDLKNCKAVVGNAGFTLISEAVHLGKPIFAIPLKNHFEQILNGIYATKEGYGVSDSNPGRNDFVKFFSKADKFKRKKSKRKDNKEFFKILEEEIKRTIR